MHARAGSRRELHEAGASQAVCEQTHSMGFAGDAQNPLFEGMSVVCLPAAILSLCPNAGARAGNIIAVPQCRCSLRARRQRRVGDAAFDGQGCTAARKSSALMVAEGMSAQNPHSLRG
jgi:hypothetical protein